MKNKNEPGKQLRVLRFVGIILLQCMLGVSFPAARAIESQPQE